MTGEELVNPVQTKQMSFQGRALFFDLRTKQTFSVTPQQYEEAQRNFDQWNGHHFTGYVGHESGDPYPSVVAWRSLNAEDMGEPFYPKCLGTLLDY